MSRQHPNSREDNKQELQRREQSRNAVPGFENTSSPSPNNTRNREDHTFLSRLDPNRLNDLYERSSI